jgi:uncharacterized membrane protein
MQTREKEDCMAHEISPADHGAAKAPFFRPFSWLRPKYLLFGFIGLMLAYVLVHDESFLVDPKDPEWQHIQLFRWWLLPHGLAGACALLLGPMQFSDRLRQRFIKLHRIVGRVYIGCAFIAAPLGVYIEHVDERLGFARSFTIETMFQGGMWMLTTAIALAFILKGKVQQHRQWMTRSFGTGPLIFLEVRVIGGLTGWETLGPHANEIIVWACTASSILIADLVLQAEELYRSRSIRAKAKAQSIVREAGGIIEVST